MEALISDHFAHSHHWIASVAVHAPDGIGAWTCYVQQSSRCRLRRNINFHLQAALGDDVYQLTSYIAAFRHNVLLRGGGVTLGNVLS